MSLKCYIIATMHSLTYNNQKCRNIVQKAVVSDILLECEQKLSYHQVNKEVQEPKMQRLVSVALKSIRNMRLVTDINL